MSKQQEIEMTGPGVARPKINEIEKAANKYVEKRDARMKLTEQEVTEKRNLISICNENLSQLTPDGNGNFTYKFDDVVVTLKPGKTNVKVGHDTAGAEDSDGDDD